MQIFSLVFFIFLLTSAGQGPEAKVKAPEELIGKEFREAIYFSASLEKEALKILTRNSSFDDQTLFSVLSFAVETNSRVKKSSPPHMDCSRFRFQKNLDNSRFIQVYKVCEKPETLIAELQASLDKKRMTVVFYTTKWTSVIGLAATLSGKNIECELKVEKKKLTGLNCNHWSRMLNVSTTGAEELRLKTFLFARESTPQFILKGGIYKDLVERKKIEVLVPLDGKIKRIEKEIEVIDEFAGRDGTTNPPAVSVPPTRSGRITLDGKASSPSQVFEIQENPDTKKMAPVNPNKDEFVPYEGQQNSENGGIPPVGR